MPPDTVIENPILNSPFEEPWSTLYLTVSRPFPKPESDRIAIKVINHYGDEVLKVYEV